MTTISEKLSSIIINQNRRPSSFRDNLDVADSLWRYQEFFLPDNFARGAESGERTIPSLTGTQLLVNIENQSPVKAVGLNSILTDEYAQDAQSLGATSLRVEIWHDTVNHGVAGVSDTPALAQSLLSNRGIKMLPMVNQYGLAWNDSAWEAAAVAAVPYADLGVIEIANEPYGSWFWSAAQARDPGGYAKMVARCADAVAPYGIEVTFAVGGTGSGGLDYQRPDDSWSQNGSGGGWINDALASGTGVPNLLDRIGGIAVHPYGILPGETGAQHVAAVEALLVAKGVALPLWFTECGRKVGTANGFPSSPEIQAQAAIIYYHDYLFSEDHNVAGVWWFNHRDFTPMDPAGDNGWGLIDETNHKRPAWSAIQAEASSYVPPTTPQNPMVDWTLEYQLFGVGWLKLASGTTTETHLTGPRVWLDLVFDNPVVITEEMLSQRFRLGFKSDSLTSNVSKVWYSTPNPLASQFASAKKADGVTPIQGLGQDVSFLFRVLGLVADSGTDFLGNSYRSLVVYSSEDNASALNGDPNKFWLSKPNPSRFAVESLYFDVRPSGDKPTYGLTNLVQDPDGTGLNTYWQNASTSGTTITGPARSTAWSKSGAGSIYYKAVNPDTTNRSIVVRTGTVFTSREMFVRGGKRYVFRSAVNLVQNWGTSMRAGIAWFDAAGNTVAANIITIPMTAGSEAEIVITEVAPPTANRAYLRWLPNSAPTTTNSTFEIYIDEIMMVQADSGTPEYFSGNRPDSVWSGAPDASVSMQVIDPEIEDNDAIIDRVLVDPITPGVYFSLYYTSEGQPAKADSEWDSKLWTRVPQTFKATKREAHVLPEPIRAKYIKVEFTHLQARPYAPGNFAKPMAYKKHPKWVLDYFLARVESQRQLEGRLTDGRVGVVYDAIDLAYSYYLDDVRQSPNTPIEIDSRYSTVQNFLADQANLSDKLDPIMLDKIKLSLQPYRESIARFADPDTLLGGLVSNTLTTSQADYPVERSQATFPDVNALRDSEVIFESDYPVMFFYLTCRHMYRETVAEFDHDRAYFAGVREVAFTRDRYTVAYDNQLYIEPHGDLLNVERNDFVLKEGSLVI